MTKLEIWLTIAECFRSPSVQDCPYKELPFYMTIDDVSTTDDGRAVVSGLIATGTVYVDDSVRVGWGRFGTVQGILLEGTLEEIEMGEAGDQVNILLDITNDSHIENGMGVYHAYLGSNYHIDWKRLIEVIQEKFGVVMLKKELTKRAYDVYSIVYSIQEKLEKQAALSCNNETNSNFKRTQNAESKSSDNTQKGIENLYNELLYIIRDAKQDVSELQGVNSSFNTIKRNIGEKLNKQVEIAGKELSKALKNTVWDNLVIAFFGETNAGKSTIIETFRILFDLDRQEGDGLIVGDGRHDFTKTYEEYKLSIGGHQFTLIDVPGIEGNEEEFKDVIQVALHKAHCVFYVQGHNKKPDEATARKIKNYLDDWVKVYSIYNVRGGAGNYDEEEERETLLTEGVLKTEKLIQIELKKILGDVYAGHITLQALLAMSAKAVFSEQREDLIKTQQKLIRYFGSSERIMQFSQFQTLINLVEQKVSNFQSEILEANKQKLMSLANQISSQISLAMEGQKNGLKRLGDNLKIVEREVCNNYLDSAYRNILNKSKNAIDSIYGSLKAKVFELIDSEEKDIKERVECIQECLLEELESRIRSIVRDELSRASNNANRKIKELDGIRLASINFHVNVELNAEINFSGALSELDIDLDDVLGWLTKTAGTAVVGAGIGSVFPVVGTLFGAAIGAVVGGIAHAASGDGGKANAKNSVSEAVGKAKGEAKQNLEEALSPVLRDIENEKKKIKSLVKKELNNIENLNESIDGFNEGIETFVKRLKDNGYGRI